MSHIALVPEKVAYISSITTLRLTRSFHSNIVSGGAQFNADE
jgi:hypothetical protein